MVRPPGVSKRIKRKGSLTKLGYEADRSTEKRRRALTKAVKKFGFPKTISKLTAVQVLSKTKNPEFSETLAKDKQYLRQTFRPSSLRER